MTIVRPAVNDFVADELLLLLLLHVDLLVSILYTR